MIPRFYYKLLCLSLLLVCLMGPLSACAPKLTREMLTPSPTVSSTPLPTRTPDPNRRPTSTPKPRVEQEQTASPTPESAQPAVPTPTVKPNVLLLQGLTVEEYPLGSAPEYDLKPTSYDKNAEFYAKIPAGIFEKHQDLWMMSNPSRMDYEEVNRALEPFGYRLEKDEKQSGEQYRIYRGDELLVAHVTSYENIRLNSAGTDFILPVTIDNYEIWILQKDRFELWYAGEPRHLPVFAGDDLVSIGLPEEFEENGSVVYGVPILINDQPKYRLALPYRGANMCPVEKFRAWKDQWVLEMEGEVLVGGEPLTEEFGYMEVFNWQALNGKPFFLFKDAGRYGVYYDDQELSLTYREIVRWSCLDQQGGSGYNFSARGNDFIAGFFARRGNDWFYVEIGKFK